MIRPPEIILYRLLISLLSPLLMLWLLREAWQQKSWQWLWARLGKTTPTNADVWLHCASVGEINAAAPLVYELHQQGIPLLITTFTATGQQQALRRFAHLHNIHIRPLPIDWRWTTKRFLSHIRCSQLLLVETEFWPTLITEAKQKSITVSLINARITNKTLNAPYWWRRLLVQLLDKKISQILCRNAQDLADFRQLGVTTDNISVAGNLKWCEQASISCVQHYQHPYIVFASTHHAEEIELATLWQHYPDLPQLVIVPRHPKRSQNIAQQFKQANIAFSHASKQIIDNNDIILVDTFGELQSWMAHAELVIMGGSFAPKGGQNPLEAIRLEKMVICGADMRDFELEVHALRSTGALIQVKTMNNVITEITHLLKQPEDMVIRAHAGKHWLTENQAHILKNYVTSLHMNNLNMHTKSANTNPTGSV